ncbi:hypothetical protein [Sorangium sp. So ce1153]|uniref:hypothetical protein n=1 Tax=Sorangium sp. So ce1153 TaxID=3133333 RepID=UPI003F63B124
MSTSKNKYFSTSPATPEHPRIRAWRSYRKDPACHHVEVEVRREREGLVFLPASIFVFFCGADGSIVKDVEAPWEPALEEWLIDEQKAKAVSRDNEKLRFSLLLKPALRPALVRFGDGYFNAVLIALLREGPFRDHTEVAEMLHEIREYPPGVESLADCQAHIDHALSEAAKRLLGLYQGDSETAEDILGGAVALYLDERFNVTNRKLLGF